MSRLEVLDTFPEFLKYWAHVQDKSIDDQIKLWSSAYMSGYPELLAKQIEDYAGQNIDGMTIAREKAFPFLNDRLPAMHEARKNLLDLCPSIYSKAQQALDFESDAIFVIYVGIGCGAGWVTPYQDQPAILFGLENIAECGWSGVDAIRGLISHEIGHVVHFHWRSQKNKPSGDGTWWQLYEEGFAQRCETLINESAPWHQETADTDWLEWCQCHKSWLAAEFIRMTEANQPMIAFFGSWFDIDGKSQTGYFLGCEVVKELEKEYSLKEIALLDDIDTPLRIILEKMKREN